MTISKAQQKAVAKYDAKAYDKTLLRLPKGKLDVVRAHAEAQGESVNGFIGRSIQETMERDSAPQEAAGAPAGGGVVSLPPEALKTAKQAADAAGEDVPVFVARAIESRAKLDRRKKAKGGGTGGDDQEA